MRLLLISLGLVDSTKSNVPFFKIGLGLVAKAPEQLTNQNLICFTFELSSSSLIHGRLKLDNTDGLKMVAQDSISEASRMILSSDWLVGFTGAGLSEESGISTYRDPGGLWDRYPEGASGGIMGILRRHPEWYILRQYFLF